MLLTALLGMLLPLAGGVGGQSTTFDFRKYLKPDSISQLIDREEVSKECGGHLLKWVRGLQNKEIWALQMMDSIQKTVDGVLLGRTHFPGHFDECVRATNEEFEGKYCMVQAAVNFLNFEVQRPFSQSKMPVSYSYGICAPSTCSTKDLNVVVENLTPLVKLKNLTDNDCSLHGYRPLRTEDWVTVGLIAFLLLLAVASTAYDLAQRLYFKNDNPNQFLISFSFYTNARSLFRTSGTANDLKCLNGIRCISIAWVVLGHSYVTIVLAAPINFTDALTYFFDKNLIPINNAFLAVETFFFLSGLLACLVFFRDISKKGHFDVPVAFLHRYLRVTPAFGMIMLLQATLIPRIGNGPFWNYHMDKAENDCRSSWWTGLLYLQNYVKPEALCLGQSWYLSTDMQMFWLSPFFLYPMLFWPTLAPMYLLFLVLLSVTTNFVVAFINEFEPNLSIALGLNNVDQFKYEYIRLHTRMTPWFIGLATGYVICGIKAGKVRLKLAQGWVVFGWSLGLGLCASCFFCIIRFFSYNYTPLESALYLSLHRAGWSLGLAWIVIACVSGYGGPINYILSLNFLQPLAKLSYSTFLIHMTLQLYRLYSSRLNQYVRNFDIVYMYAGDIIFANILAIPVTLLFELPFGAIDKYLFQKLTIFPFPRKSKKLITITEDCSEKPVGPSIKAIEKGNDNLCFEMNTELRN